VYRKLVNALYLINIISQAIFTLAIPIALGFGVSWLLVNHLCVGSWIYALLITIGAISGFVSMIKFVLSAMNALEHLEKEREESKKTDKTGNNNE
jgi:formate hydrogenlyase subunit 3/multisubunit Na+/H+ antiporter MnhD subunit